MFSIPYIGWVIPIAALLILVALFKVFIRIFGLVMVPDNRVGVVTKKFSLGKDGKLPDGALIAMKGEAGIQADTLAPGLHFGFWPWQYQVDLVPFATIPEGKIGTVEARDGVPLSGGRVLARQVECNSYQDARAFLSSKGERGPQMAIIPPGTYRINTALFTISTEDVTEIPDNKVGIVTTKEGSGLPSGEIAGRMIEGHNMFQNGEIFVAKGGFKGLQEQVILAGRYYINPNFATVEMVDMTEVPIAYAGVVIAYVGEKGADVTGDGFKHGNLVEKGKKGVWIEPLDPGRYPINPRTHRVENVPTANVVLNWATGKSEAHKLDEKLSTITVRSSDGFKFNLDVSQIIHIPRNDAPKVIARFGSMLNLVTQVLEPTIGNYFRNAAQGSDVIEFLNKRAERQQDAREKISAALTEYNVGAVDTLIGDIVPPEDLMKTLTDRKIAEQEKVTYETQCGAEKVRQGLQQAKALADTQAKVVDSERSVAIAEFAAQASVKKAEGEAKSKTMIAEADGNVITTLGRAEAEKTKAVGLAEAEVTTAKVRATDPEKFVAVEIARALSNSGQKLVPDILVSGQGSQEGKGSGTTIIELLAAQMFKDQLRPSKPAAGPAS
jgi:uncharacterized membrane protein YqiK